MPFSSRGCENEKGGSGGGGGDSGDSASVMHVDITASLTDETSRLA